MPINMTPRLVVITGPMFCGKSEELLRRLRLHGYANDSVLALKPKLDSRQGSIRSRRLGIGGSVTVEEFPAFEVGGAREFSALLRKHHPDVLAIDEAQFFDSWLFAKVNELLLQQNLGITIYVVGLDLDAWGQPFGQMGNFMARADEVLKFTAICMLCHEPAGLSCKIGGGSRNLVEVGDGDIYQARCRRCWSPPASA